MSILQTSFADIEDILLGKRELRSLFFALVVFLVVLVLGESTCLSPSMHCAILAIGLLASKKLL